MTCPCLSGETQGADLQKHIAVGQGKGRPQIPERQGRPFQTATRNCSRHVREHSVTWVCFCFRSVRIVVCTWKSLPRQKGFSWPHLPRALSCWGGFPVISMDVPGLTGAHPIQVRVEPMSPSQWDRDGHCAHPWHEGSQCSAYRVLGSGLQVTQLSRSFDNTLETGPCCILSAPCRGALLTIFDPSVNTGSLRGAPCERSQRSELSTCTDFATSCLLGQ